VPVIVIVKAGPPTFAVDGERLVIVGVGGRTTKVRALDTIPPAEAMIDAFPGNESRLAGICALSCVELPKVVASAIPFQDSVVPLVNPVPFAISVKPAPPVVALFGDRLVSVMLCVILTGSVGGVIWPGALTPTCATPAVAISPPGTCAVS